MGSFAKTIFLRTYLLNVPRDRVLPMGTKLERLSFVIHMINRSRSWLVCRDPSLVHEGSESDTNHEDSDDLPHQTRQYFWGTLREILHHCLHHFVSK